LWRWVRVKRSTPRGVVMRTLVHDQAAEEKFVANAFAAQRYPVTYNNIVLVGPKADPAGVKGNDIVSVAGSLSRMHEVAAASLAPRPVLGLRSSTS